MIVPASTGTPAALQRSQVTQARDRTISRTPRPPSRKATMARMMAVLMSTAGAPPASCGDYACVPLPAGQATRLRNISAFCWATGLRAMKASASGMVRFQASGKRCLSDWHFTA